MYVAGAHLKTRDQIIFRALALDRVMTGAVCHPTVPRAPPLICCDYHAVHRVVAGHYIDPEVGVMKRDIANPAVEDLTQFQGVGAVFLEVPTIAITGKHEADL